MAKAFKRKDLAKVLGVSNTLVSLVLNNKGDRYGIKKSTQEKVLAAAGKMGYFNDDEEELAVLDKPGIIAMVVTSFDDRFVMSVSEYLQKAFSATGFGFSVVARDNDTDRFKRLMKAYKRFFSGIILYGDVVGENTVSCLLSDDYPFVAIESKQIAERMNSVRTDIETGFNLAVSHIGKNGYRNILIVGRKSQTWEMSLLWKALKKSDAVNVETVLADGDFSKPGEDVFSRINVLLHPPFSADMIVVMKAVDVFPTMEFLTGKKIRVPHDVALISMEDDEAFRFSCPSITSVGRPIVEIAEKTAQILCTEIKNSWNSTYKKQLVLIPEFIVRDSCKNL